MLLNSKSNTKTNNMQIKTPKIIYGYGTVRKIQTHFMSTSGKALTDQTIRNALKFVTDSELAREIRQVAMDQGAVLTETTTEM